MGIKRRAVVMVLACLTAVLGFGEAMPVSYGDQPRFDVNDISYLWPVPATKEDVARLISVDEQLADGTSQIWPKAAFEKVIQTATTVEVTNSAGRQNTISFGAFGGQFVLPNTWKVAGFRVDPSAPGCDVQLIAIFGSTPQIRLIVQPVTVNDAGAVIVHDVTAHLVFNFVKGDGQPAAPDKEKFLEIVNDLKELKAACAAAGVSTARGLGVHPGFERNVPGFAEKVRSFLKKHLAEERLGAVAFMGLEPPEPWIFFAMNKQMNGTFVRSPHPSLGGKDAQMLIFRGGTHVMPSPSTKNVDKKL
jgi:hypothetical protein